MALARGRWPTLLAVSLVFIGNGAVVGAWAVRIAEVQRVHGLSETGLGAALICVGIGPCWRWARP